MSPHQRVPREDERIEPERRALRRKDARRKFVVICHLVMALKRWVRIARRKRYERMNESMMTSVGRVGNSWSERKRASTDSKRMTMKRGSLYSDNVRLMGKLLRVSVKDSTISSELHVEVKHYASGKTNVSIFRQKDWAHVNTKTTDQMDREELQELAGHLCKQALAQTKSIEQMKARGVPSHFASEEAFAEFLRQVGVDPGRFGIRGAKELKDFLAEVENGDCALKFNKAGSLVRALHVVNAIVISASNPDLILQKDWRKDKKDVVHKVVGHHRIPAVQIRGREQRTRVQGTDDQFNAVIKERAIALLAKGMRNPRIGEQIEVYSDAISGLADAITTQLRTRTSVSFPGVPGQYHIYSIKLAEIAPGAIKPPPGWVWADRDEIKGAGTAIHR